MSKINLPIYITTNYDLFIEKALKDNGKEPVSSYCIWNEQLKDINSLDDKLILKEDYEPTVSNPLVYHLYGNIINEKSMAVTEQNFLEFIVYLRYKN